MTKETAPAQQSRTPRGGHTWLMMICCIPMVVIVVALVATGAASSGFLVTAGLCVGMMFVMMRLMDHGGGHAAT